MPELAEAKSDARRAVVETEIGLLGVGVGAAHDAGADSEFRHGAQGAIRVPRLRSPVPIGHGARAFAALSEHHILGRSRDDRSAPAEALRGRALALLHDVPGYFDGLHFVAVG